MMQEILFLVVGLLVGGVAAWLLANRFLKRGLVSREALITAEEKLTQSEKDLEILRKEYADIRHYLEEERRRLSETQKELELKTQFLEATKQELVQQNERIALLNTQTTQAQVEAKEWEVKVGNLKEELEKGKAKQAEFKEMIQSEFKNMATEILDRNTRKFASQNKESLATILNPLQERLEGFKKKVEDVYEKGASQRTELRTEIKMLHDLNKRVSEEANNLAKALKGEAKVQGDWGEMILKTLLEESALLEGKHYSFQPFLQENGEMVRDGEGRRKRPDVVIHFPREREVIVDSKVSLSAYADYAAADDPEEQEKALKKHLYSIKRHIQELSKKGYEEYGKTLEFVFMFIPVEPAFLVALKAEPKLWDEAYAKRILIISPTNFYTAIKMVEDLWKREDQERNVEEIIDRANKMYEKFSNYYYSMSELGSALDRSQEAYQKAKGQLKEGPGSFYRQLQMMEELGLNPKKRLPKE